ncbi:MAG: class I SAM-dependent methyltransferase [Candidatus Omnitrophica bacterium]|nr:class I SAM-dependent methyltransferase [Candidatus Omnitrophota bacterium]
MMSPEASTLRVQSYWDAHIHDSVIARQEAGTELFFQELAEYHFDKLDYLMRVAGFDRYAGKRVLEVGCGIGIDLVRFARGGARVTGVDLSERAVELAGKNFSYQGLAAQLEVMDGEALKYADSSFDFVYAHGVLQYTPNPERMVSEIRRVLKPGGEALLQVYNRWSWLNALSKITRVDIEHLNAPILRLYSPEEFKRLVSAFASVSIFTERFPVKSRLHRGVMAFFYNSLFVPAFNLIPRIFVKSFGWHLIAKAVK